jgi:hypothetical protein
MCTPTINNIVVNHTLIDGGADLNIIYVEIFEKMQVPYHHLMPTRPSLRQKGLAVTGIFSHTFTIQPPAGDN